MPISLPEPTELLPVPGVRIATTAAEIKYKNRNDLVLFEFCEAAKTAVVLTQNQFCAAPVIIAREHISRSSPRYLLVNSGNANAGTGELGLADTKKICSDLATKTKCNVKDILPFSTGVIGERLPVDKIQNKLSGLIKNLANNQWLQAAQAIMTTDTVAKGYSNKIKLGNKFITITGIAKGAGMICPNMATMLAYIATDLEIHTKEINELLKNAVDQSFHCITVDGDTSTNDACVLVATGKSGVSFSDLEEKDKHRFINTLNEIFLKLAQAIIRDGEGATKFINVKVEQAKDIKTAREIAFAIAHSPLVKTAAFASDPNWGRILAAAGRATTSLLPIKKISLYINKLEVFSNGELAKDYTEKNGQYEMQKDEIQFLLQLGVGDSNASIWTTDLSHEYVKINAEYRT